MIKCGDLICNNCIHRNVCRNIYTYKKLLEAIHSVSIPIGEKSTTIYITNIDWLTSIDPKCKHYQMEPNSLR